MAGQSRQRKVVEIKRVKNVGEGEAGEIKDVVEGMVLILHPNTSNSTQNYQLLFTPNVWKPHHVDAQSAANVHALQISEHLHGKLAR